MKQITKTNYVIHGFAFLHAVATLAFRLTIGSDELALTLLTVAMVVYISIIWKAPIYVGLSLAMIASFAGYYIGAAGADLLFDELGVFRNSLMTLFISETIGWIVYFIVRKR